MSENEHGHPAAGLCKKCWRSFTDRSAFDAHTRSKCETASRSKREKFQALIDTFCGTEQDRHTSDTTNTDEDHDDAEDAPASATSSRSQSRIEDVVTRREYQSLVDRVATLEQMLTGGMSLSTPRTMPSQQHAVARAFTASPAMPSQAFGYYSFAPAAGPSSSTVAVGQAAAAGSREPRTSVLGGMDARTLEGAAGDHTATGFYNDRNRIASTTAYRSHTMDHSVPTVRSATSSPLIATGGGGHSGPAAQQAGGNPSTGRAVSDASYGADRVAAAAGGNSGHFPGQPHQHHHQQTFGSAVVTSAEDDGRVSQHSTSAMMRNRWEHAVQVGDEMMMRGMDFFHGGQGSGDDLSKYLNMDSQ